MTNSFITWYLHSTSYVFVRSFSQHFIVHTPITLDYEHFHKTDRQLLILEIAQKDAPSLDKYAIGTFVTNGLIKPAVKRLLPAISPFTYIKEIPRG